MRINIKEGFIHQNKSKANIPRDRRMTVMTKHAIPRASSILYFHVRLRRFLRLGWTKKNFLIFVYRHTNSKSRQGIQYIYKSRWIGSCLKIIH